MPAQAYEITRTQLLAELRPDGVTPAKLHRWQDAGLFPGGRREGRGRPLRGSRGREPRGSVSYYHRMAVVQARIIVRVLRARRNLDEAGWALWVLGFREPDAEWVRELLVDELQAASRAVAQEYRRDQRGDQRSAFARAGARRPLVGTEAMRGVLPPTSLPVVLRMMAELRLGLLRERQYGKRQWRWFQDASFAEFAPDLLHEVGVPSPDEVRDGITRLSGEINDRAVIAALKTVKPVWLRIYTNEAQQVFEMAVDALGLGTDWVMPRDYFLTYFKARALRSDTQPKLATAIKELGWTKPPDTPLNRLRHELNPQAAPGPTPPATDQEHQ